MNIIITPQYIKGNFSVVEMFSDTFINSILTKEADKDIAKDYMVKIKDKVDRIVNYFSEVNYKVDKNNIFELNPALSEITYYNLNKESIDKEYLEYNKLIDELVNFVKNRGE